MDFAKLEDNVVINIVYFDPAYGYSLEELKKDNLVPVKNYPVWIGDTYDFETERFYRNNEKLLSYQEELEAALQILLTGVETDV